MRIAMENTERTLYGSRCLVLGYGRIGKVLSERLADMGAEVTVCTRNEKDVALAAVMGHKAVKLDYISGCLQGSEIIFNTIPKKVVTGDMLGEISKSALIIDLASKPYGIDMTAAEVLGRKVIVASGLPGKFTPESSGAILKDVIMKILIECRHLTCTIFKLLKDLNISLCNLSNINISNKLDKFNLLLGCISNLRQCCIKSCNISFERLIERYQVLLKKIDRIYSIS